MMQKHIVIYLHPTTETESVVASWIILDTSGSIIQTIEQSDLNQLSVTSGSEIYVIVPMQDVLLASTDLPKLSRQRLMQALPFALEEQLITNVSELHFAIGNYQNDNSLPVAIVSKQKMIEWLQFLEQFNITPRAFIPAIFMLPYKDRSWQINNSKNNTLVRTGLLSGFACEEENLETLLKLNLAEQADGTSVDLIRTHQSIQQLLEKLPTDIDKLTFINLLQNPYQPKPQSTKVKKNWLIASYLLLAWIGLAFFSNIISFFILQHQNNNIETQINEIYKRNFPNASTVVAPDKRMTEKLHSLSGQTSKNNFLVVLSELGNSLLKSPGIHIKNFDFREQQLTLEITAATFDNVDQLIQNLKQKLLSVKQQNAAEAGTQVTATLLIRAGVI